MAVSTILPIDEIVLGASARLTVIDGIQYLSIRDVLMHITGQNNKGASKTWERLDDSKKEEVSTECRNFKFPGQGQSEQPVITFRGVLKLIMWVGGENAKKYRSIMVSILQRYYAGDDSLCDDIEANKQSDAPVAQLARASLPVESASTNLLEPAAKKRQLEREDALFEMEMAERRQKLMQSTAESQMKVMSVQKMLMESYALLCPNQVMDDRARLLFKDNLLNIATSSTPARAPLALENGAVGAQQVNLNKPITISTLAAELGYRFDNSALQKIGKKVASAYREKYGENPGKHEQLVGQASIAVNSYTERDRGLVERVIVDFINE